MSTAMQIIKKAIREEKGVEILISGSEIMGDRPPILFRYKTNFNNGVVQETNHHGEKVVIEADLRNPLNKVAYVYHGKEKLEVMLEHVGVTSSVKSNRPVYAFLSKHIYTLLDEHGLPKVGKEPTIHHTDENLYGNEW